MEPTEWWASVNAGAFRRNLLRWYAIAGRALPWRTTHDPYPIWVSEIMLQQTQVAAVIPYYKSFLLRFPTLNDLAAADENDVLRCWQGLGYYGRARHLHRAAQTLVRCHGGEFPRDPRVLARLPGLGRYTANAIASFAWDQRAAVLEANTIRLWTRLCAATGVPRRAPLYGQLWRLAEQALPKRNSRDFNHALMDLGAVVCRPTEPRCPCCPVRQVCQAWRTGQAESLPQSPPRRAAVSVDHVAVVLWHGSAVLIRRRPDDGPWARLWEFPRVEREADEPLDKAAHRAIAAVTDAPFRLAESLVELRHSVMHYRVRLVCFTAIATTDATGKAAPPIASDTDVRWLDIRHLGEFPFSAPQRRIADMLPAIWKKRHGRTTVPQPDRK